MKQKSMIALLLSVPLALTACASIVHGTNQQETITTIPSGAHIRIDDKFYGHTPVTADLKRNETHVIDTSLQGYKPTQIILEKHVSGWMFGNILFGGIIGIIVDAADGAMYKLEPNQMAMVAGNQTIKVKDNTINIILVRSVAKTLRKQKIGQLHPAS